MMMMLFKKLSPLSIAALLLLGLNACSNEEQDPFAGDPPAYIYAVGHKALQAHRWNEALSAYESLDSQYPFDPYTQKADLDSIYAYYRNNDPAMALTEAARYIKIYPTDPQGLAYAYYMMGVVDFENGRGFLQRYFPYHMSQHNAENYTNAFNYFNTVVTSYPDSPYAADARRRMIYLNNTLAEFNLNVGEFYYDQGAYVAAANRAVAVILNYPSSPMTEDALVLLSDSYAALGLSGFQHDTDRILQLNFPDDAGDED